MRQWSIMAIIYIDVALGACSGRQGYCKSKASYSALFQGQLFYSYYIYAIAQGTKNSLF